MEPVRERDDVGAALHLAREFQCSLHGIGAGWARKLDFVVHVARPQDHPLQRLEELLLGDRRHVETVHHAIRLDVLEQALLQHGIVVSVVERPGTAEEIDVTASFRIHQHGAVRFRKQRWKRTDITPHLGFQTVEDLEIHGFGLLVVKVVIVMRP